MITAKIHRDSFLTSHQVGALIQADPTSIQNWVEKGWLKAFRTPGGHRRIRVRDLLTFLSEHHMPVPRDLSFKRRVMLVDDQQRELAAFARLLSPFEELLEVRALDNGIDALIQVGSFQPELIVLDVFMPSLDGREVLQRLKANPETARIEVIVASGRWTPALESEALASGALACVPKPIDVELVIEALGIERQAQAV